MENNPNNNLGQKKLTPEEGVKNKMLNTKYKIK